MTTTDQRWLTQLLSINKGSRFFLSALPLYSRVKDDPQKLVEFQSEFDKWIDSTGSKYVSRGSADYLRVR